jgi:hypothetical protein
MAKTQHECLQNDVEFYAFIQKEIDVTKDEIHYENERYQGEGEEERSDVIADDIALEGHGFIPSTDKHGKPRPYINNNCFAYKQFVNVTPDRPTWARSSHASGGAERQGSVCRWEIVAKK